MNWEKGTLHFEATIQDALQILNRGALRVVLIVESNRRLIGTVSDGDIRRGLLRGMKLSSPIAPIVNLKPTVVTEKVPKEKVLKLMSEKQLFQIPVIDNNKNVIGLHLWDQLYCYSDIETPFVIMAGGRGSRLLPLTQDIPKPMLRIGDEPILEHIIIRAKKYGFKNFVIAIHHLGEVITDYFGDGSSLGVKIEYLHESKPLGTAGALTLIDSQIKGPILVTNGDVLSDVRYSEILDFHNNSGAVATVAVRPYEFQNPYGVIQTNGVEITNYVEKPITSSLINAGVYVIEASVIGNLEKNGYYNMPDVLQLLMTKNQKVIAYLVHESWIDVGRPDDLKNASIENK
jgi:dTDP-glucose pyrophosphorylase